MEDTLSRYDIIGDIHGRWDKLEPLLTELGYHHDGVCHLHSEGRTVIFLGDLIDHGETMQTEHVRCSAVCVI